MTNSKEVFSKKPLTLREQTDLLEGRGLAMPDRARATRYLQFIGYYRLAVYCRPLQEKGDSSHGFKPGVQFDDVLGLYVFDRQLRLLVMDAIERIEVAVRTVLNDHMALKYGPQWYTDHVHFQRAKKKFNHLQFIRLVQKETGYNGTESDGPAFCRAYFSKYCEPLLPPSWMVSEVLPIGSWSRVYSVLTEPSDRKAISNAFRVRYELFGSWLHAVSFVRNVCAHHSLLWNSTFTVKPRLKNEFPDVTRNDKFYAQAVVVQHLMKHINAKSSWGKRLIAHVELCPLSPQEHMGFPENWAMKAPWAGDG